MNKKYFPIITIFLFTALTVLAGKLSKTDLAFLYNENKFTDFQAQVYHNSNEKSIVYLKVQLKDLKYLPDLANNVNFARFKINYELYESYQSRNPVDTASFIFTDTTRFEKDLEMIVDFDFMAEFPKKYILQIFLTDLNREEKPQVFKLVEVRKDDPKTAQNFFLTDEEGYPLFGRYMGTEAYFKIQFNDTSIKEIHIRYYQRELPIAKTPFAPEKEYTFKFEPDSFYTITLTRGVSELLELPYYGIYHFQSDLKQTEGLTLFHFDDGFPEISSPEQAVAPLRYLTTQKEFDELIHYQDMKTAVDSFWLERASHQTERAKNMIQRYYSRVQDANVLFYSFLEGWKTDRGLIYIIYGPPSEVYREADKEEWIYGERGNPLSIKFYFYKVDNPFTNNDFRLQRSPIYKTSWYIAIENWRR
jgi:GWxTD domain-containing protein